MKLHTNRDELLKVATLAASIAGRVNGFEVLLHAKLIANEKGLTIIATDTERTIEATIEAQVSEYGERLINANKLVKALRVMLGDVVEVEFKPPLLRFASGNTEVNLHSLPVEDFPQVDLDHAGAAFVVKGADLERLARRIGPFISDNPQRYGINGAHFEAIERGGEQRVRLVATDGHRLAYDDASYTGVIAPPERMIISPAALDELRKLGAMMPEEAIRLIFHENSLSARTETLRVHLRLMDGEFPDYSKVIPAEAQREVSVRRHLLLAALAPHMIIAEEDDLKKDVKGWPLRMEIRPTGIRMSYDARVKGLTSSALAVEEMEGESLDIGFNPFYLRETAKTMDDNVVKLSLGDGLSPMKLEEPKNPGALFIVMPMRLD